MNEDDAKNVMIEVEVPEQLMSDILVTAFDGTYGGVWQAGWAKPRHDEAGKQIISIDDRGGVVYDIWKSVDLEIVYADTALKVGLTHTIDHEAIARGLNAMLNGEEKASLKTREILAEAILDDDASMIDANIADNIVQCAIWGKEMFS